MRPSLIGDNWQIAPKKKCFLLNIFANHSENEENEMTERNKTKTKTSETILLDVWTNDFVTLYPFCISYVDDDACM